VTHTCGCGVIAVDVYRALGALSLAWGLAYLVRGANLAGRAGQFMYPHSTEWREWNARAPAGYWRTGGVSLGLFGMAILLMTEACFHREFFVLGLLAWGLGLTVGLLARGRYGPFPRRTRGYWVRNTLLYILSYAVIQTLIHTGSLGICGVSG
jgi:hypothetical protein